jgi:hypothetical protein
MKLTVEMFGLSPFTDTNAVEVEVEVEDGAEASLDQVIAALGRKLPALRGRVIDPARDRLVENYGLYVNSQFVSDDDQVRVKQTDRVVLILLATGG